MIENNEIYFHSKTYAKKDIILADSSGIKYFIHAGEIMYLTNTGMFMEYNIPRFGPDTFFYWDCEIDVNNFIDNFMDEQKFKKWLREKKLTNITKLEIN